MCSSFGGMSRDYAVIRARGLDTGDYLAIETLIANTGKASSGVPGQTATEAVMEKGSPQEAEGQR
jgi:hypothetical protein